MMNSYVFTYHGAGVRAIHRSMSDTVTLTDALRPFSIIRFSYIRKQGLDLEKMLILYFLTLCVLRFLREGLDLKI